jgi:hypothetical protein
VWILPKSLQSRCVPGMRALDWGSTECFQVCESSLTRRLKSTPARFWRRAWKAGFLTLPRFGAILEPSQERIFTEKWTSSLADIPASPSPLPASGKAKTTLDTFGRILQQSCGQLSLFAASSKMYPDTLPLDSPQFIEAYETWVTRLRQDCLQRQRSAHPTSGSDCLSWRSPAVQEPGVSVDRLEGAIGARMYDSETGRLAQCGLTQQVQWPTPNVPNRGCESQTSKDSRPDSGGIDLQTAVLWLTPQHSEYKGQSQRGHDAPGDRLTNMVSLTDGPQAPDSLNTSGKNQGLWCTPNVGMIRAENCNYAEHGQNHLIQDVRGHGSKSLKLNPDWVEQLMGVPNGWTRIDEAVRNVRQDDPSCAVPREPKEILQSAVQGCRGGQAERESSTTDVPCVRKTNFRQEPTQGEILRARLLPQSEDSSQAVQGDSTAKMQSDDQGNAVYSLWRGDSSTEASSRYSGQTERCRSPLSEVSHEGALEPRNLGHSGMAQRVDRLRLLGNGVVPAQAAKAWTVLFRIFEAQA